MDERGIVEQILSDLSADKLENAAMGCLRLARHRKDHLYIALFLMDLALDGEGVRRTFEEDAAELSDDERTKIWSSAAARFISSRRIRGGEDDGPEVHGVSVGAFDNTIAQFEAAIKDFRPAQMSTAAYMEHVSLMRRQISSLNGARANVKARFLNYAIRVEKELELEKKAESFLREVQLTVDNYFSTESQNVYQKLQKASELLDSTDLESHALLLTEVRRAVKAVADHFYPAVDKPVRCSDGKERKLDDASYLNRLYEFLATAFPSSTSRDLLRKELDCLGAFVDRLNDIASKGVHDDVTLDEAKQGLVGLYMFLFNVVSRLQKEGNKKTRPSDLP